MSFIDLVKEKPFIIAEIGINHNGDIQIAKNLIDMAVEAGCDAVKFQKRTIDIVYSAELLDSPRQSPWGTTQREQKEGLEFGAEEYLEIDRYCKEKNILWSASAWDLESQRFLQDFNLPFNKVASAMLPHKDLLEMIADEGKFTFISTGMSDYDLIDKVVSMFEAKNCPFAIMHCVSVYPCPNDWCNIKMILSLKERYNCIVGYSGHEKGILPSTLAVSLGAEVLERHITLDRTMYGSDQSASLEKRGLELMVREARQIGSVLGNGKKEMMDEESQIAYKLRYFNEDSFDWSCTSQKG